MAQLSDGIPNAPWTNKWAQEGYKTKMEKKNVFLKIGDEHVLK